MYFSGKCRISFFLSLNHVPKCLLSSGINWLSASLLVSLMMESWCFSIQVQTARGFFAPTDADPFRVPRIVSCHVDLCCSFFSLILIHCLLKCDSLDYWQYYDPRQVLLCHDTGPPPLALVLPGVISLQFLNRIKYIWSCSNNLGQTLIGCVGWLCLILFSWEDLYGVYGVWLLAKLCLVWVAGNMWNT